jgi:hypothetical protein
VEVLAPPVLRDGLARTTADLADLAAIYKVRLT